MSMAGARIRCPLCLEVIVKPYFSPGYNAADIERHLREYHKMTMDWVEQCPGCHNLFFAHNRLQHYLDHIHDASHWIEAATRAAFGEAADAH